MSATLSTPKTTSGGEIIRELVNASDGQGLHFNGAAGNIDIASPPDLGTKFSFEFIIQADSYSLTDAIRIIDFGTGGRFLFGWWTGLSNNLSIYSVSTWSSFEVKVLDDLKVHHLVVTVDGTAAILYDNGNQVGTATIALPDIDNCTDARIGSEYNNATNPFNGTLYRTRFWNKTLTSAEVTATYENATVPFADQYGSQTELLTNNNFSSGDTGWNKNAGWTIVDQGGGDYEAVATSVANANVIFQTPAALTAGKKYRLTYTVTAISAGGFNWRSGGTSNIATTRTTVGTFTEEITITDALGDILGILAVGTTTGRIDDVSVVEIGCVSDYDLAFANQKQSLVVEDRSGSKTDAPAGVNATGMMSASGVTQVTPIEQLNTKSLSVGTVAATPADGQIIVGNGLKVNAGTIQLDDVAESIDFLQSGAINFDSNGDQTGRTLTIGSNRAGGASGGTTNLVLTEDGNVGVGVAPVNNLTVLTTGDAADDAAQSTFALMLQKSSDVAGQEIGIGFRSSTALAATSSAGGAITFERTAASSVGSLHFKTAPSGDQLDTRLTIDSAGKTLLQRGTTNGSGVVNTLQLKNSGTSVSDGSKILFTSGTSTDGAGIGSGGVALNSADLKFYTGGNNMRLNITAAGLATFSSGIAFQSATTGTGTGTGYTLDSYEEGTWTPVIGGGTCTNVVGKYTRVGNKVTVTVSVLNGTLTSATNNQISGLPFTIGSTRSVTSAVAYYNVLEVANPYGLLLNGTTLIDMDYNTAGATWAGANFTNTASAYLHFSATYFV